MTSPRYLRYLVCAVPFLVFLGFMLVCARGLHQDPRNLQSTLIDKPAPPLNLPVLNSRRIMQTEDLRGHPYILHVWASWCLSCRAEHPILVDLARQGTIPIYGLAYKETPDTVRAWLSEYGDPYRAVLLDARGQAAIEWGVYGTPETFFVDGGGTVRHRHVGALTHAVWQQEFLPLVERYKYA